MSRLLKASLYIFLLLFNYELYSLQKFINLEGIVKSASTQDVLPYATVFVGDGSYSTVSEEDGSFRLSIPTRYIDDSLQVQYLGFHSLALRIGSQRSFLCELQEHIMSLEEMTIRPRVEAKEVVKMAVAKMEDNYQAQAYEQEAYYLETIQQQGRFTGFAEASLRILNGGYNPKYTKGKYIYLDSDVVRYGQIRKSEYSLENNRFGHERKIGVNYLLRMKKNILHQSLLSKSGLKEMDFQLKHHTTIDQQAVLAISFSPKQNNKVTGNFQRFGLTSSYQGTIYIKEADYGIVRVEINIDNLSHLYPTIVHKQDSAYTKLKSAFATIQYKYIRGKYHLAYIGLKEGYLNNGTESIDEHYQLFFSHTEKPLTTVSSIIKEKYGISEIYGCVVIQKHPWQATEKLYDSAFWATYKKPVKINQTTLFNDLSAIHQKDIYLQFEENPTTNVKPIP